MIAEITITILDESEDNNVKNDTRLIITGRTDDGTTLINWNIHYWLAIQYITEPIYNIDRILKGESGRILESPPNSNVLWLEAPDSETDHYAVSLRYRETDDPEERLLKPPQPVSLDALARAILDFGSEMLSIYERVYPDNERRKLSIEPLLVDARRQYEYYQDHGTLDGYQSSISREHFETYLEFHPTGDRLEELVLSTDAISSYVEYLHEGPNEQDLFQVYQQLLYDSKHKVTKRTLESLLEQDSPNAPAFLVYLSIQESSDSPYKDPAIRLLPRLEYDSDDLANIVDEYTRILAEGDPDLVRAVIEAVDGIEPGELEDRDRRDLVEALENAADEAADGEMQRNLKTLVDLFDD